jgi:hypothetical protein
MTLHWIAVVPSYSAPLKRFWFLIALGAVVGVALAITSAYSVGLGVPPKLTAREQPEYTAGTQLEVTSAVSPYYRSAVDVPVVSATRPSTQEEGEEEPTNLVEQAEPTTGTLINAANYYPFVIEGDDVKALRERMFGVIEGEIQAEAVGVTITPSRYEPGRLPFIQVFATADSEKNAIDLAQNTAQAFIRYVQVEQQRNRIRPAQRLAVKQLRRPVEAFAAGGTSPSFPVLVFFAVVMVFVGLAFLLDRLIPRRAQADEEPEEQFLRPAPRDELVAAPGSREA